MKPIPHRPPAPLRAVVIDGANGVARVEMRAQLQWSKSVNEDFEDVRQFFESERRALRWFLAGGALASTLLLVAFLAGSPPA